MGVPPHLLAMGGWDREDEGISFERRVISRVITVLGLQRASRTAPGGKITTARGFNRMFRDFPVTFDTLATKSAAKFTLLRMLNSPQQQTSVKRFYEFLDTVSPGDYAALIVRVDGFPDGLAFHNMVDLRRQTTQLVVRPPKASAFCVEATAKFVKYAVQKTGWAFNPEG